MTVDPDKRTFESQGFGHSLDWELPAALLIIDFVRGFTKPDVFGGFNTRSAALNTIAVLDRFRQLAWPVAFTRIVYANDSSDANIFSQKVPSVLSLTEDNPDSHVIDELKPLDGELVVCKTAPSAFFGTSLLTFLTQKGIKTIAIAGATTSGCVRASVVDAMSFGFKPIVITDCVGDRVESAHVSSLRDMGMKYADLATSQDFFERLHHS
jgi:maleamate amidohydrolase